MTTLASLVGRRLVLTSGRGYVVRVTSRGLVVQIDRGPRLHHVQPDQIIDWLPD